MRSAGADWIHLADASNPNVSRNVDQVIIPDDGIKLVCAARSGLCTNQALCSKSERTIIYGKSCSSKAGSIKSSSGGTGKHYNFPSL